MFAKLFNAPTISLLVVAGLVSIMTVGGCPAPQTPNTPPADNTGDQTTTPPGGGTGDDTIDRPVQQPDIDQDTSTSDSGGTNENGSSGSGGGGGGGQQGESGAVLLTVSQPSDSIAVRPGTIVAVAFDMVDLAGSVKSGELLLSRDDDGDGEPDTDGSGATLDPAMTQAISVTEGSNAIAFDTNQAVGLLTNGFGRFVVGVRLTTSSGEKKTEYSPATLTIDAVEPTADWVSPDADNLINRDTSWVVELETSDNSDHSVRILLDQDTTPENGNEFELVAETTFAAGTNVSHVFSNMLSAFPAGTYYYYVIVSDGIDPPVTFFAQDQVSGQALRLSVTNRLIGEFRLDDLVDAPTNPAQSKGAIMEGFNFNDMAGSSMAAVPDLDGDGASELVIVARFGKPFIIQQDGVGFGEAYLVYGNPTRMSGVLPLNGIASGLLPGVVFPGIRTPLTNIKWTEGLSDVTIVPDMDGDDLPEIVFSFPRVESLSLSVRNSAFQHPENFPDLGGMGGLEYDAIDPMMGWISNKAQFTRGGIVIVSSHNANLSNRDLLNRKGNRVIDLHEVGQIFASMSKPSLVPFIRQADLLASGTAECPDPTDPNQTIESPYEIYQVSWDVAFDNQGPGGFHQPWHNTDANPPLANPPIFPFSLPDYPLYPDSCTPAADPPCDPCADNDGDGEPDACHWFSVWYVWGGGLMPFPCTSLVGIPSWDAGGVAVWTGFYGPNTRPRDYTIGARVLGEKVDDHFGTTIGSDGTWLYISAPKRTADPNDVPLLAANRNDAGVVYQFRTDTHPSGSPFTHSQLWMEPGTRTDPNDPNSIITRSWPFVDAEIPNRVDAAMPVPHQYIIESVGSSRTNWDTMVDYYFPGGSSEECPPKYIEEGAPTAGRNAGWCTGPANYQTTQSAYYVDRTPQIVGPHDNAEVSFVRGLGDVNDDGVADFAVGSDQIQEPDPGDPDAGNAVGAIYVVFGRPTGVEGDYLLEQLHLAPSDPERLRGIMLKGSSSGEKLARVFDDAGDVNGDGVADVLVGNEAAAGGGEAIVILGSSQLSSPEYGWTVDDIVGAGNAVRFSGVDAGDDAGANVAGAGDVDGDGFADILIAAPGAEGGAGVVYLVYGSANMSGEYDLADIGTVDLPGVKFIGRKAGDQLGGGEKTVAGTGPGGTSTNAFSRGVTRLGDIDGDGRGDLAISAMLADPHERQDAGEVYVIYGRGD